MKIIEGDLVALALDGTFDVIVHGCNCQCVMGAGIAKSIRSAFPEAWHADQKTGAGDRNKLGKFTSALAQTAKGTVWVANAYTQFERRGPMPRVDYDAVQQAMRAIRKAFPGRRFGYPKIGAGIGGGDWAVLSAIIDDALDGEDHTLVKYMPVVT